MFFIIFIRALLYIKYSLHIKYVKNSNLKAIASCDFSFACYWTRESMEKYPHCGIVSIFFLKALIPGILSLHNILIYFMFCFNKLSTDICFSLILFKKLVPLMFILLLVCENKFADTVKNFHRSG